jgi:hypothetical protein
MNLLEKAKQEDINNLCPYAQRLFKELKPILGNIDPMKISEESKIEISPIKKDWLLHISIEPKDRNVPGLHIEASKSEFILTYAGGCQLEDHSNPASDADYLIKESVDNTARYLNGVTIVQYYNRKGKSFMKKYYYGINTENDKDKLIGTDLSFFSKAHSTKRITYKFT